MKSKGLYLLCMIHQLQNHPTSFYADKQFPVQIQYPWQNHSGGQYHRHGQNYGQVCSPIFSLQGNNNLIPFTKKSEEKMYTYPKVGSSPWQSRPKYPVGRSFCCTIKRSSQFNLSFHCPSVPQPITQPKLKMVNIFFLLCYLCYFRQFIFLFSKWIVQHVTQQTGVII